MNDSHLRRYLRLDLGSFQPPPRVSIASRVISNERYPQIAALMLEAYRGTIDDEGEDLNDAVGELAATERGDYGPPLRQLWLEVIRGDGSAASAVICTRFAGVPFVSSVFTSHSDTRRGLATSLILDVTDRLIAAGETSLSLFVTVGNPAEHLYERLGFLDAEHPPASAE